uniref:Flagellar biosynthesis/type III secretory pathway protein n=1 Tax=Eubacterium cellulosolvens (strain ATCC 43171 / JCM 9499 / 6) TaxID=633697 RepID=I5ARW7_EUBC6
MISSSNRVIKNNESVRVTKFNPLHTALYGDGDGSVTVKFPEIGALEKQLEEEEDANNPELSEGKREALRILEEAKKEAGLIIEAAKEEAEKLRKEASERGYEEGHEKGLEEGRLEGMRKCEEEAEVQTEAFRAEMTDALGAVAKTKQRILERYMNELKDLAITVAEKVIHVSLNSSGRVIERMISDEAEKHKKTAWVKIYMNKRDYNMMAETDRDMVSELSNLSDNIKFVVMDDEPEGYAIMETPEEIVDLSVNTQLSNIRDKIREVHLEGLVEDV